MRGIDGKTAVVTGGASGIGRATARRFAGEGASVVVVDVDEPGGRETVESIRESGGEATFVEADVTDEDAVAAMVEAAAEAFGGIDVLHNNAGIENAPKPLTEKTVGEFEYVQSVNLKGVFLGLKHVLPHMAEAGGGAVVNSASIAGLVGAQQGSAYAASKHGVVGLTRTAALEYASEGVRVNAVCPGFVRTRMVEQLEDDDSPIDLDRTPQMRLVGRLADPEEVAGPVVWLCSDDASYVNGVALPIDAGATAE